MLSKVRGDINPADVLTKPKSLEDMRLLLNFSCLNWCDGRVPDNHYSGNRIEFVNSMVGKNRCGDSSCGFVNCVGNIRIFKDGEFKCVDSFGVSSLEYARNGDRKYFVNSSTVRRRGGVGVRTVCFGPSSNVLTIVVGNITAVGCLLPM